MRTAVPSPVRRARLGRRARPSARGPTPLLEVRLGPGPVGHPLAELFHREGAQARLLACRLTGRRPRRVLRWLEVVIPPGRREHLLQQLERHVPRRHLALAPLGPDRLMVRFSELAPPACEATYRAGGLCEACPMLVRAERGSWRVILPPGEGARAFLRGLPPALNVPAAIAPPRRAGSRTNLTRRQDRALRTAFELGYFGYPRRGSLADVAGALGIGRSATLEILRRATGKLAESRYGDELRSPATL